MNLLLILKPIKANKWSVRWIPMGRKPYLNNGISKEICFLHSWDEIAVPPKIGAKLSGAGLNMTVFIPWKCSEEEKSSEVLIQSQPIVQWNKSQKGWENQYVPAEALMKVNCFLFVLAFPFHFYFRFKCFRQSLHC